MALAAEPPPDLLGRLEDLVPPAEVEQPPRGLRQLPHPPPAKAAPCGDGNPLRIQSEPRAWPIDAGDGVREVRVGDGGFPTQPQAQAEAECLIEICPAVQIPRHDAIAPAILQSAHPVVVEAEALGEVQRRLGPRLPLPVPPGEHVTTSPGGIG